MTSFRMLAVTAILGAGMIAPWSAGAAESDYPSKPIRMIVPFPAGGTTDVVARLIGAKLGEAWGSTVVVENMGGASGMIGTAAGVRAAADGYTITIGNNQTHATNAALFPKAQFDLTKDVQPIAMLTRTRHAIVVPADSPYETLDALVAGGKQKALNYASSSMGSSSHLVSGTLCAQEGMDCTHVPYQGAAGAITDLLAGHVDFMTASYASAVTYMTAGRLRGLAISGEEREVQAPNVATLGELGRETLSADSWIGVFAPAGTPRPVVEKWSAELERIMAMPDVKSRLEAAGFEVWYQPVAQFEDFHRQEIKRWADMVEASGVELQ
ncbi:tripartite tricarboxylate transporter substrate binding protein [Verticiella sediminum]|uniref:Tripartite tricarboxylate transporter substrate binding protein n=1 Tax=Verticiella sediminum TaxID=1247510 RepID=A0A556AVE1_9BURK|nr:tripartite tricarboxylate transporter substrate binding protein [Verticiella sediminum]TSH96896.1 tripartite tricarboxylate transporter substrate binding protein [Verticiella sediminum]